MSEETFMARPWGKWRVLAIQPGYTVTKPTINPGCSLSKQYHTHRDEYWVIFKGKGELLLDYQRKEFASGKDEMTVYLRPGIFIKIPKEVIHKVTNTGDEPLIILETQIGEITEEGDIVRLD